MQTGVLPFFYFTTKYYLTFPPTHDIMDTEYYNYKGVVGLKISIKPQYKILLYILAACVLVVSTTLGTLAWLTSQTETVTNTFTYGKVQITMDEAVVDENGVAADQANNRTETGNEYKLVPGRNYVKDPTIHVDPDSENCFLFVKIENQIGTAASYTLTDLSAGMATNGNSVIDYDIPWELLETNGNTSIYYLPFAVLPGADVEVFPEFTFSSAVSDMAPYEDQQINITAYAIQAEGFTDENGMVQRDTAWAALNQ